MELALRRGIGKIHIVTVLVHTWRLSLFLQELLCEHPGFRDLEITVKTSEAVLLAAASERYGPRVRRIHTSQASMRTVQLETLGVNKILNGTYT